MFMYRPNNIPSIFFKLSRLINVYYFMGFKPVFLHSLFSRYLIKSNVDYMLFQYLH